MALNGAPGDKGSGASPVVLVLGMPDSVHTAHWLNMMRGRGIQVVLLPVHDAPISKEIQRARFIAGPADLIRTSHEGIGVFDVDSVPADEIEVVRSQFNYQPWRPDWLFSLQLTHPGHVVAAIRRLRPALVHSMVAQFGGYLGFASREYLKEEFPAWLLSNWGSDISLFRKLPDHESRIKDILAVLDGYHAECERDVRIARQMGFRRFVFPVMPASGGIDFTKIQTLDAFERPSDRREILIKGYHGWAGRALHILSAIHLAAEALRGYKIRITLAGDAAEEMATAIANSDGLDIEIEPYLPKHADALLRLAKSRIVVGLGISDGISTTLLEAMAVGTFPIQGSGSCGSEWFEPDKTGMLVSPHDIGGLAEAIRRGCRDDALVDAAAPRNREVVEARWNCEINGPIAVRNYRALIERGRGARDLEQYLGGSPVAHA
jgi:glycosyltransferase involved in cell wall biosynthesis